MFFHFLVGAVVDLFGDFWCGLVVVRTQELVALSGAHTLGNKGFGNPNLFDNSYFQILLQKPWENAGTYVDLPFYNGFLNSSYWKTFCLHMWLDPLL